MYVYPEISHSKDTEIIHQFEEKHLPGVSVRDKTVQVKYQHTDRVAHDVAIATSLKRNVMIIFLYIMIWYLK